MVAKRTSDDWPTLTRRTLRFNALLSRSRVTHVSILPVCTNEVERSDSVLQLLFSFEQKVVFRIVPYSIYVFDLFLQASFKHC
jgi:hypothetical protein